MPLPSSQRSAPSTARLAALMIVALVAACGGGAGGGSSPAATPAVVPEVFLTDHTTGARRLLGATEDGSGSLVLVPDAARLLSGGGLTLKTDLGLVYTLKGASSYIREIRLVSLDGRTDRLLRAVDDSLYQTRLIGVRGAHLAIEVLDSHYTGAIEALPLAGGDPVRLCASGQAIQLGATSLVYLDNTPGAPSPYRVGQLATGASQAFALRGVLTALPGGGFLMGSYATSLYDPLVLLTDDFAPVRTFAPVGTLAWPHPTAQTWEATVPVAGDRLFGLVPEGEGRRLMAYARGGAAAVRLDGSILAGSDFRVIGVSGTRLIYRAQVPDAAPGYSLAAYRIVPATGGTPLDLAPLANRDDERVIGLTSTCLVVASGKAQDLSRVRFLPLDGSAPTDVDAWAPGGTSETQAWIVGDRLAHVAFDGTTYRLVSVDALGLGSRTHLEGAAMIFGQNPNGTGIRAGRMCFSRGAELHLLDPAGPAATLLRGGATPTYFAGWSRTRVLFSFQEGATYPLWSARMDGTDLRRISPDASLVDVP
ncbi:MAG: hypothetical protein H6P99_1589 [Holophagaceae bacterium]|nr:hypothetical protein [Holophagaceae bacterium]